MIQKYAKTRRYLEGFIGAVFDCLKKAAALGVGAAILAASAGGGMIGVAGATSGEGALEGGESVAEAGASGGLAEEVVAEVAQAVESEWSGDSEWQFLREREQELELEELVDGSDVTVIGDSITEYSLEEVKNYLPEAKISAVSGTEFEEANTFGESGMERLRETGMRQIVVFAMGTNGGVTEEDVAELLAETGERPVILMTLYRPEARAGASDPNADYEVGASNAVIWKAGYENDNVYIMDWAGLVAESEEEYLRDDRLHPNAEGSEAFARMMRDAVWGVMQELEAQAQAGWVRNTLPVDVWMGLAVLGIVVVTAAVVSVAVGLARGRAWRRRERAQQRWREERGLEAVLEDGDDGSETEEREGVEMNDVHVDDLETGGVNVDETDSSGAEIDAAEFDGADFDEAEKQEQQPVQEVTEVEEAVIVEEVADGVDEEFEEAFYVDGRELEEQIMAAFGEIEEVVREEKNEKSVVKTTTSESAEKVVQNVAQNEVKDEKRENGEKREKNAPKLAENAKNSSEKLTKVEKVVQNVPEKSEKLVRELPKSNGAGRKRRTRRGSARKRGKK